VSGNQYVADLGPVRAAVVDAHDAVADLLGDLPLLERGANDGVEVAWTIEGRLAAPGEGMRRMSQQVGYRGDRPSRHLLICSEDPRHLAVAVRDAVLEVLADYCEARGCTMLRASAVADDQRVVIMAGGRGDGKTTLALSAVAAGGRWILSDDELILYRTEQGLVLASVPTATPGRGSPAHICLDGMNTTIVLARYALADEPVSAHWVTDPEQELWRYVRFDLAFGRKAGTSFLPRAERSRATFARDTASRLSELTEATSLALHWCHHGELAPLLDAVNSSLEGAR
jgi:hypothetical protein